MTEQIDSLPPDAKLLTRFNNGHKVYLLPGVKSEGEFVVAVVEFPTGNIYEMPIRDAKSRFGQNRKLTAAEAALEEEMNAHATGEFNDVAYTDEEAATLNYSSTRNSYRTGPGGKKIIVTKRRLPSGEIVETEQDFTEFTQKMKAMTQKANQPKRSNRDEVL